jgi:hypothetical protein
MKSKLIFLLLSISLTLMATFVVPAQVAASCSGDDCGCYDPPCTEQCAPGDQTCFHACVHGQVQCAILCCS